MIDHLVRLWMRLNFETISLSRISSIYLIDIKSTSIWRGNSESVWDTYVIGNEDRKVVEHVSRAIDVS